MKKFAVIALGLTMFCFGSFSSLEALINHASNGKVINLSRKLYLREEQIHFSNAKIYIDLEDVTYETPAVFTDENGYYIEKIAVSGDCAWYEWQCHGCKTCNLRGVDWTCKSCYRPISE